METVVQVRWLRLNTNSNEKVQVDEKDIEDVNSFVYLGANVSKSGGTEEDIKARLGKARAAYNKLGKIWKNSQFTSRHGSGAIDGARRLGRKNTMPEMFCPIRDRVCKCFWKWSDKSRCPGAISQLLRTFAAPTFADYKFSSRPTINCPWVSEDGCNVMLSA